ncbi:thioesterase family protein [Nocardia sp. NPDC004860]|uniref:thioesterase family protein n=1 Tax=Nocardia sp. NPDC004860 TaxID=3154557 RepID=UPI0033A81A17
MSNEQAILDRGPSAFQVAFQPQWSDMDQNGHMRTTGYLAAAENCRMQYFAGSGFSAGEFAQRGFGPVIQTDELRYRTELRLLEPARLSLHLAGLSNDGARFMMRNTFTRADGTVAATVTSTGGWLDLTQRRLTSPPDDLLTLLRDLARTIDFADLPSPLANR